MRMASSWAVEQSKVMCCDDDDVSSWWKLSRSRKHWRTAVADSASINYMPQRTKHTNEVSVTVQLQILCVNVYSEYFNMARSEPVQSGWCELALTNCRLTCNSRTKLTTLPTVDMQWRKSRKISYVQSLGQGCWGNLPKFGGNTNSLMTWGTICAKN